MHCMQMLIALVSTVTGSPLAMPIQIMMIPARNTAVVIHLIFGLFEFMTYISSLSDALIRSFDAA